MITENEKIMLDYLISRSENGVTDFIDWEEIHAATGFGLMRAWPATEHLEKWGKIEVREMVRQDHGWQLISYTILDTTVSDEDYFRWTNGTT